MASDPTTPDDDDFDPLGGDDIDPLGGGLVDLGDDIDPLEEDPDPTPDPLADVEYTGNVAEDAARELTALEEGYRARAAQEANRFTEATDSEFWFAVVFKNREQKDDFLAQYGLSQLGDKYLLGRDVERILEGR
jgi:hypothetical protein